MRIEITAQAPSREQLIRLLQQIEIDLGKPQYLGIKERGNDYGITWEIVPDKHDETT